MIKASVNKFSKTREGNYIDDKSGCLGVIPG